MTPALRGAAAREKIIDGPSRPQELWADWDIPCPELETAEKNPIIYIIPIDISS